jgi:hypothetical protein
MFIIFALPLILGIGGLLMLYLSKKRVYKWMGLAIAIACFSFFIYAAKETEGAL